MLNKFQIGQVWENLLSAEARALYFGALVTRYTAQKQWITGISFFLSSGAAASAIAKAPFWVPAVPAFLVSALIAYAIAVNLDGKIAIMAKLYASWSRIATEYQRLWSHVSADDAEFTFARIVEMEREPSELATGNAPNDQELLGKWQEHVFALYNMKTHA